MLFNKHWFSNLSFSPWFPISFENNLPKAVPYKMVATRTFFTTNTTFTHQYCMNNHNKTCNIVLYQAQLWLLTNATEDNVTT